MKKLMTLLAAVLFAGIANAQAPEKGLTWAGEVGLGNQISGAVRAQYNFNQYIAWDVATLKYGHDWDYNFGEWSLKTGLRGYSPAFGPNLKAFAALDMGYVGMHASAGGVSDYSSCFGLDFTIGVHVWKGLYVGYGLDSYHRDHWSHVDHFARIGWQF